MAEKQSVTADIHQPFSGPRPQPSVVHGDDDGNDSHGGSLPLTTEAARAALLQLRESVTSADFERLINAVTESTPSEKTTSEIDVEPSTMSDDDDDDDMEASSTSTSGDGDTVKDNNEMVAGGSVRGIVLDSRIACSSTSTSLQLHRSVFPSFMAEKQSVSADIHRPFSGPPPQPTVVHGDGNGNDGHGGLSLPLTMEAARAALLQLRESVTSADFLNLINGVTSDSTPSETTTSEIDVEPSTTSDDDNDDMESSSTSTSGDGDTVKDNELAGAYNTGGVSMNEGVASGNAHTSDEWKEVRLNKRKKVSKDSKSSDKSASAVGTAKKTKVDTGLFLYLKGQDFDLAKEVIRQPVEYGRKLASLAGPVREVKILKDSIRISCNTPRQKGILMQVVD